MRQYLSPGVRGAAPVRPSPAQRRCEGGHLLPLLVLDRTDVVTAADQDDRCTGVLGGPVGEDGLQAVGVPLPHLGEAGPRQMGLQPAGRPRHVPFAGGIGGGGRHTHPGRRTVQQCVDAIVRAGVDGGSGCRITCSLPYRPAQRSRVIGKASACGPRGSSGAVRCSARARGSPGVRPPGAEGGPDAGPQKRTAGAEAPRNSQWRNLSRFCWPSGGTPTPSRRSGGTPGPFPDRPLRGSTGPGQDGAEDHDSRSSRRAPPPP
ncbi:hypothetical protein SUDANB6_00173 [Streptomyces sp. enrichment culture]